MWVALTPLVIEKDHRHLLIESAQHSLCPIRDFGSAYLEKKNQYLRDMDLEDEAKHVPTWKRMRNN